MQLCNAIVKIAHYLCYTSARGIFDLLFVQNEAFQAAIYPNWVYWRLKVSTCDPSDIGEIARSERPKRLNRRHNFGMYPCAKPANPSVPGSPRRKLPSRKRRPMGGSLRETCSRMQIWCSLWKAVTKKLCKLSSHPIAKKFCCFPRQWKEYPIIYLIQSKIHQID